MTNTHDANRFGSIDAEALLNWLDQEEELEYLRNHAGRTLCEYRPNKPTSSQRITLTGDDSLPRKGGMLQKILEQVWVPSQNMRGKAYATPELDKSINSVAKLMCIGTLWDFFTTIPIFQFSLSGPLSALSFPAATILSFILLISSNYAGENSTNKSRGNGWMANVSLSAFLILCVTKTLFSGVGIDLWVGSRSIASKYAGELAGAKLEQDRKQLPLLETPGDDYSVAKKECDDLERQMNTLDRARDEKMWTSLYVKARGTNASQAEMKGKKANEIIRIWGSRANIPACPRANILLEISEGKAAKLRNSVFANSQRINELPPLAYLEKQEPELYSEHFKTINGELRWVNGTEAVGQATKQFYDSLFRGELGLLGFSLFSLAISVILTLASAIMIYVISLNSKTKASFTGGLRLHLNEKLSTYEQAVTHFLTEAGDAASANSSTIAANEQSEHTDFDVKPMKWIINNAQSPEDKEYAKRIYQQRVFDLWRKHVSSTGQTYYPPLASDLYDYYQLGEANV